MISKGDTVRDYEVITAHTQDDHDGRTQGVALGYAVHKREYAVWFVNGDDAHTGFYTYDVGAALLRYVERVTNRLFTHHNKMSPGISFDVRPRTIV